MVLTSLNKHRHIGLLILRIGIGCMFLLHGASKPVWRHREMEQLGTAMENLDIGLVPAFWGFMVAISEFIGGVCLIFGLFFRPACILLTVTMTVVAISHFSEGKGLREASHAIEAGILSLSFILIGAGKYSLDEKLNPPQEKESL